MSRRIFYPINKALFFLSLKGMGIGNWETSSISGEAWFINRFARFNNRPTVIDIGANIGKYSELVRRCSPSANIYAFEAHPHTFRCLQDSAATHTYNALNIACTDSIGTGVLFDHKQPEGEAGTEHASLIAEVIEGIHSDDSTSFEVSLTTLDSITEELGIQKVDLLKIDVEGAEINVLRGADKLLKEGAIDIIQFEFTETAIANRTFLRDFNNILKGYRFFRLLSDGFAPLGVYYPAIYEIFGYQNIVAIREEIADEFLRAE